MRRIQRLISFILAMVMVASSVNLVSADSDANTSGTGGTGSGGGASSTNSGDDVTAGFKVELLWLDLDEEIYNMKPSDEKTALIQDAFNNAKNDYSDTEHTGAVIEHIGNPLYMTSDEIASVSGNLTAEVYCYGDSVYGLGNRDGNTGIDRGEKRPTTATLESISAIKSKAASLSYDNSTLGSVISNYVSSYSDLPIFMGNKSNIPNASSYDQYWQDYFMALRPVDTRTEYTGEYIARPTLCALVNYISTYCGALTEYTIYFKDVYVNDTQKIVHPGMPEKIGDYIPNCYDTGVWEGKTGVYKIIFEQIYRVNANGFGAMFLTGRDFIYVAEQQAGNLGVSATSQDTIIGWQYKMFRQLIGNFSLGHDDIWNLKAAPVGFFDGDSLSGIVEKIKGGYGGGLGTFSSLDTYSEPEASSTPTYIGSITNVFLPGSLDSEVTDIKAASLEYIGPKSGGETDTTTTALENASIQIAKIMSGGNVSASDNIFTNKDVTSPSVLLNGTIKLPGIQVSGTTASGFVSTQGYAEKYMEALRKLIDGTGDGTLNLDDTTRANIKKLLLEELGIDLDSTDTNSISLTDLSLAMYILSNYQLDGVEADGTGYEVYNSPANRWKEILAYQAMLENDKSKDTINTSSEEAGAWAGPLSITASDITDFSNNGRFNTVPLKNEDKTKLKGYPQTSEGAEQAIDDGVLDNAETGQISIHENSQSVWNEIVNAGELSNGLVRVPIAMGTTQLHLMTGDNKSFNIQKAQLGQIQADVLTGLVDACTDSEGNLVETTTTQALESLWPGVSILDTEYPAVLPNYHNVGSGTLSTEANLDNISTGSDTRIKDLLKGNKTLFAQVVEGESFNSVYNKSDFKGKSISFNTFGLNTLIDIAIPAHLGQYTNHYTSAGYNMAAINPNLIKSPINGVYSNPGGIVAIPSYVYYKAETDSNDNVTMETIANSYIDTLKSMTSSARTINDAVFAAKSNNSPSLILAASNYLLNKGLADSKTDISTDVVSDQNIPVTNIKGDYGLSYIIWDSAMPVDIQLVTEIDGKIVPIEAANQGYDGGLISNVWYAVPNQDKALELQKYYTVKKGDTEVTLEVEEAVVKSATVNDASGLQAFYDAYSKAYNADSDDFTYEGKTNEGKATKYTTTRTKFTKQSASNNNVEAYTYTHTNVSSALRYITSTGAGLGLPTSIGNLTGYVVNTMDIVPSSEDKQVYLENTSQNRLQVIVKVKASTKLVQYNMVEGLDGNYIIETEPKICEHPTIGTYIEIDPFIDTRLGTAYLADETELYAAGESLYCAFTSTIDKNPNTEKPLLEDGNTLWDATKYSMPEWAKTVVEIGNTQVENYRYLYTMERENSEDDIPGTDPTETASVDSARSTENTDLALSYNPKVRAVYVHYVERPPVYEIYRKSDGSEEIVKREQNWNKTTLVASSGESDGHGNYDNLIGDQHIYYPVMAVAADLNYGTAQSTDAITVTDGVRSINTPTSWQWVLDNLTTELGAGKNVKKTAMGNTTALDSKYAEVYDVQTVGINGLYKTATGNPIQITSFSDSSESGFFGYSRGSGAKSYVTDSGNTISWADSRCVIDSEPIPGFSVPISPDFAKTSVSRADKKPTNSTQSYYRGKEWFYGSFARDTVYETVNTDKLNYNPDYVQPTYYTVYILYVQGERVNNIQNSFYAVLPQDMITRAVAYRDLARQYYQREQVVRYTAYNTESSLSDEDLGKTARIPISDFTDELSKFLIDGFAKGDSYEPQTYVKNSTLTEGFTHSGTSKSLTFTYRTKITSHSNATLVGGAWGSEVKNSSNGSYCTRTVSINSSSYPYLYAYANAAEGNLDDLADRLNYILAATCGGSLNGKLYTPDKKYYVFSDYFTPTALANVAENVLVGGNNCVIITESGQAVGDSTQYWRCNFNTWYTLYINLGDPAVQRVDYSGVAENANGRFETATTTSFNDTFASIDFGPTGKQLGNQYTDGTDYFNPSKNNYQYIIPASTEDGSDTIEKLLIYVQTGLGTERGLADLYNVEFGIQGYGSGADTTPGTIANNTANTVFFASKPYSAIERIAKDRANVSKTENGTIKGFKLANNTTNGTITSLDEDTGYWKDYYHYYNDYNFYVLVWRGMEKPNLASAAKESEQITDGGNSIQEIQTKAISELCSKPIGLTDKMINQFTGAVYQPANNTAVAPNLWAEDMYPAYVNMGAISDVSNTNSLMTNGYTWHYNTKSLDSNTRALINGSGEHLYSNGDTGERDIDAGSGGSGDVYTSDLANGNSFTTFKGNLLVDSLIDNAGVGNKTSVNEVSSSEFTMQGGERYNRQPLTFSKSITQGIGNSWDSSDGSANLWVNFYPWVKMRYQTINSSQYYTEDSTVTTKDAYVLAKNQSTLVLNSVLDIGFSRGEDPTGTVNYNAGNTVPNKLEIGSTQWSTHANALSKYGKGNVLPGGAIYTLTTGSISASATNDALARSKVAIRYWKPYVPDSMMSSLVETNSTTRYTTNPTKDIPLELYNAKQRYNLGDSGISNAAFKNIVEAVMQTLNNTKIGLHIDGIDGDVFDSETNNKYKLNDPGTDTSTIDFSTVGVGSGGNSGSNSKGDSVSLDTIAYQNVQPTYYRVWSDTDGNVWFGWKQTATPPTLAVLRAIGEGNVSPSAGYVKLLSSTQGLEDTWEYADASAFGGIPYGVDQRTHLITNYVRSIDRNLGFTVQGTMPAANGADSNHLLFNLPTSGLSYKDVSIYAGDINGNGIKTVPSADAITTYTALVNKFTSLKKSDSSWTPLVSDTISSPSVTDGNAIGYKWLAYSGNRALNGSKYDTYSGWYNEASDGFGVVVYGAIIEVGFAGPISTADSTQTPVRTSVIDPVWQLPHTSREDLFTNGREAYFYTKPAPNTNFVAKIYGTSGYTEEATAPVNGSNVPFIGVKTSNSHTDWIYLGEDGLDWLYRSRVFYIGNGSVMDLN